MNTGTPKTLKQAIQNGMPEFTENMMIDSTVVEAHVIDYLAQKFNVYMLRHPESEMLLKQLFIDIVKEASRGES